MPKLTAAARAKIKTSKFAIPSGRKYPIQDIARARNALVKVRQYGTADERKKVYAAVAKSYPGLAKSVGAASVSSVSKKVKVK